LIQRPDDYEKRRRSDQEIFRRERKLGDIAVRAKTELASVRDELLEAINELRANQSVDPNTGLPRQEVLRADLNRQAKIDERNNPEDPEWLGLFTYDLIGVGRVNKKLSELEADEYIATVTTIMKKQIRADSRLYQVEVGGSVTPESEYQTTDGSEPSDEEMSEEDRQLYRWAGDEFGILINRISKKEMKLMSERLLNAVNEAVASGDYPIFKKIIRKAKFVPGIHAAGFVYNAKQRDKYPDPVNFMYAVIYAMKHGGKLQKPSKQPQRNLHPLAIMNSGQ
jgi:GGDEF domain-containing protein